MCKLYGPVGRTKMILKQQVACSNPGIGYINFLNILHRILDQKSTYFWKRNELAIQFFFVITPLIKFIESTIAGSIPNVNYVSLIFYLKKDTKAQFFSNIKINSVLWVSSAIRVPQTLAILDFFTAKSLYLQKHKKYLNLQNFFLLWTLTARFIQHIEGKSCT